MNGSLYLTLEDSASSFNDIESLTLTLSKIGLIDQKYQDNYLCGEKFAQLIVFMGCSPHLVFEPPADGNTSFCHIKIHHHDQIQLLTGQQTAPPRCPNCRKRITDWQNLTQSPNEKWQCADCNTTSTVSQLDWRQSGGAGKIFIEIKNIFPGEAVPVDRLLGELKTLSNENWRYFYLV